MSTHLEKIVKFNAQTSGREKLIRLSQYVTKFLNSILQLYYSKYAKGGVQLLELIYRLRELEQYLLSCRRFVAFGRCFDQLYSATKCMQLYDPIYRTTLSCSKLSQSFQMFADHVLWLQQMGFIEVEKQIWMARANKFWLYSVSVNLSRDFYELICILQKPVKTGDNCEESVGQNRPIKSPVKWIRQYPKLSCDFVKNFCDFWIPYTNVNKIALHPSLVSILGIVSTAMGIMQTYDKKYRLSPS